MNMKIKPNLYTPEINPSNNLKKIAKNILNNQIDDISQVSKSKSIAKITPLAVLATIPFVNKQKRNGNKKELPFVEKPILLYAGRTYEPKPDSKKGDLPDLTARVERTIADSKKKYDAIIKDDPQKADKPFKVDQYGNLVSFKGRVNKDTLKDNNLQTDQTQNYQEQKITTSPEKMNEFDELVNSDEFRFDNEKIFKNIEDLNEEQIGEAFDVLGFARGMFQLTKGLMNKDTKMAIKGSLCIIDNFAMPIKDTVIGFISDITAKLGGEIGTLMNPAGGTIVGGIVGKILGETAMRTIWAKKRDEIAEYLANSFGGDPPSGSSSPLGKAGNATYTIKEMRIIIFDKLIPNRVLKGKDREDFLNELNLDYEKTINLFGKAMDRENKRLEEIRLKELEAKRLEEERLEKEKIEKQKLEQAKINTNVQQKEGSIIQEISGFFKKLGKIFDNSKNNTKQINKIKTMHL